MLENSLMEAEADRDKLSRSARNAKERLNEMEKDRKDLADEYVVLKTNYLALVRESEKEVDYMYYVFVNTVDSRCLELG
jgi:archaellum component FlaC